jgi:2,5-diketo-D-gluconate reductase A
VASRLQIDVARTILLYLISQGFIVLPKSVHEDRIASNLQLEGLELSQADIEEIAQLGKDF